MNTGVSCSSSLPRPPRVRSRRSFIRLAMRRVSCWVITSRARNFGGRSTSLSRMLLREPCMIVSGCFSSWDTMLTKVIFRSSLARSDARSWAMLLRRSRISIAAPPMDGGSPGKISVNTCSLKRRRSARGFTWRSTRIPISSRAIQRASSEIIIWSTVCLRRDWISKFTF